MRLQHQLPIHYLQLLSQNLWEEAILREGDYALLHIWQPNNVNYHYYGIHDTFEHLTQAASGATTGDWFVML